MKKQSTKTENNESKLSKFKEFELTYGSTRSILGGREPIDPRKMPGSSGRSL